jgi:hypothetical protein
MNTQEALEIRKQYNEYDEKFRACKKQGDFRKASEWKVKRDALSAKLDEAIKLTVGKS